MPRGHTGVESNEDVDNTERGVRAVKALLEDASAP